MALTVARLQAIFGADTRPAEKALGRFTGFAKHTFSVALGTAAAMGAQALVRGFTHMAAEGLQATATFERMKMSLQALAAREIKSASAGMDMSKALALAAPRAQELFQWAKKLAIQSPFSAEGVVNAMRTAMAYGFTSKQAQRLTQNMIDFASATGASEGVMSQVALALGQIKAKGKLAGQEILQLVNAGVPVNDILGEMGYTLDDVSKGLVKSKDFMAAFTKYMNENFGGAAKRQAESWAGLMNTFDDLKKQGLAAFFEGALRALKPLVTAFSNWLQGPGLAKLKAWGEAFGKFTNKVVFGARLLLALLSGNIGQLSGMFYKLGVPQKTQERIFKFIHGFQRGLAQLRAWAGKAVGALVRRFLGLGKALGGVLGRFKGSSALGAFRGYLESLGTLIGNLWGQIQPLIEMLWDKVTGWFRENGPLINDFVTTVDGAVGTAYGALTKLVGILASQVAPAFAVIRPLVLGLVDVILGLAKVVMQAVTGDWAGAWETLKSTAAGALEAVGQAAMGLVEMIAGWFGTSWAQIEAVWKQDWEMLKLIVKTVAQNIVNAVKGKWNEIKTATKTKMMALVNDAKAKWETLKTDAQTKWDEMKTALATVLHDMVKAAKEKVQAIYQAGVDFIKGFWDGLKAKWEALKAWVNDHFGWILSLVRSIYDSHSPSRKMRQLGADIVEGWRLGMEQIYRRTNWAQYFDAGGVLASGRVALAGAVFGGGAAARHYGPVSITIQAASDPEETAREVVRLLRLNGWV